MHTIYIFGNGNISLSDFIAYYQTPLEPFVKDPDYRFILCDFRGADTLMMEWLKTETHRVEIYHIGEKPRYMPDKYKTQVSQWKCIGRFENDESRDKAAIEACTHFLAIDFNSNAKRKSGTLKNIEECISLGKIPLK